MSNQILTLIPIFLFFAALVAAALYVERAGNRAGKRIDSRMDSRIDGCDEATGAAGASKRFTGEYFLGSRSLKGVVLAMSLIATYGSVSSFVSGPGIAWQLGLGWVVFAAPQIIAGFFILGLIGKRIALVSRATGAITVIDVIRARFGSDALANFAAIALLLFFAAMMTGQFIGGAAIFAEAAGIDPIAGLLLFGCLVVLYTAFGGYRAVAWTDAVCAVLMVIGMLMLGDAVLDAAGGFSAAMENVARAGLANPETPLSESTMLSPTAGGALPFGLLFSAWILVGFGTAGLPQSAVRCMSYRTTNDLHLAMIVSTVVCGALMIGLTTLGVLARGIPGLELAGASSDHLIPRLIAQHMSPVAAGVTLIGPLAATMSTVSSLLIAASSAVVKDLALHYRPELERSPKSLSRLSIATTLVIGLIAMGFAVKPADLIAWINMAAFGGLELAFLLPLVLGLFWRRANALGAFLSALGGIVVYLVLLFFKISFFGCHAVVPAFLAAALLFVVGSFIGQPTEAKRLRPFFPLECPSAPCLDRQVGQKLSRNGGDTQ